MYDVHVNYVEIPVIAQQHQDKPDLHDEGAEFVDPGVIDSSDGHARDDFANGHRVEQARAQNLDGMTAFEKTRCKLSQLSF